MKNNASWRLKNPERWKEHQRNYREKNRDKTNAKARKRYHENKGYVLSREEVIKRSLVVREKRAIERANEIIESGQKKCTQCGIKKPLDEYYPDPRCVHSMLQSSCKECQSIKNKQYRAKKKNMILKKYNRICALCKVEIGDNTRWALHYISYNPEKKVLLCHKCHNTLHCLRIYKLDFVKKHGSDMAPYEWAKLVIQLYEIDKQLKKRA